MKIVVITGSPKKKGTSAALVEAFMKGAGEVGHEVVRFDAAFADVNPCIGCDYCKSEGSCVHLDDMERLVPNLIEADAIVFATPVYYFGMPAQLKAVVDRFYSPESMMQGNKKTALLATAYNPDVAVADALVKQYQMISNYMQWEDSKMILACGCGVREAIEKSTYPEEAYEFGKTI